MPDIKCRVAEDIPEFGKNIRHALEELIRNPPGFTCFDRRPMLPMRYRQGFMPGKSLARRHALVFADLLRTIAKSADRFDST